MPTWGLTAAMRALQPWGISESLLMPSKVLTDPIHHDVYITELERLIIDSPAFQRLRAIKQLGTTLKVFQGAEHSRFTHSLGTLRAAQDILDRVVGNRSGPRAVWSLFDEWYANGDLELRVAEATVLARLSALLHDLSHVAFGHTIEDDLKILTAHDENQERYDRLWAQLPTVATSAIECAVSHVPGAEGSRHLVDELRAIVLDKLPQEAQSLYPWVGDVVNNTICADLFDYLQRDHHMTGLPLAVGDRFLENMYVASSTNVDKPSRLVIRITRDGEERTDIASEILKYLRYRYEITERALYHKTKLAYDAMLGKMLDMWQDAAWYKLAIASYPEFARSNHVLDATWLRQQVDDAASKTNDGSQPLPSSSDLDATVKAQLEEQLVFFGDEGFLQHLVWDIEHNVAIDKREAAILNLARRILYRDHFKQIGHCGGVEVVPVAEDRADRFGSPTDRRRLEKAAAAWVGLSHAWHVVLWIPSPRMRLKVAEVLVERHGLISTLAEWEPEAQHVVKRHKNLWTVRVYAPSEVRNDEHRRQELLSFLRDELNLPLKHPDGTLAESSNDLMLRRLRDNLRLTDHEVDTVRAIVPAAHGAQTFADLLTVGTEVARKLGFGSEG